ncbi:HAMP domain-containing protein [Piscicoccus intestinalis]|uniref:HAMP domain-containing protein n=1 Tax=Piscicoccus intestinalis TaxID=746033 RepID=UPI000838B360|nr:HAMP domain-containing protein [Piscicoccus intestinalis]
MRRLTLPARLALLSMLVVAIAVSAALYAAWRTTDSRLTAEIDSDLSTQLREWDRLAAQDAPRDADSLARTARAWVREQQDHPSRQVQAVIVTGPGGAGAATAGSPGSPGSPGSAGPPGLVIGNRAWDQTARGADTAPLLGDPGPRDVRLANGSDYRVVARPVDAAAGQLGQVVVADPIDEIATARGQLARDTALIGALAMALAALLVGGGSALITRQLRRLGQVAAAAGDGDLRVRAGQLHGSPEVRDLARVFDDSLDRIEGTLAAQRAFVADASHELRTPLAVILRRPSSSAPKPTRPGARRTSRTCSARPTRRDASSTTC